MITITNKTVTLRLTTLLNIMCEYKTQNANYLDLYEMDLLLNRINRLRVWIRDSHQFPLAYAWDNVLRDCNELYRIYK